MKKVTAVHEAGNLLFHIVLKKFSTTETLTLRWEAVETSSC